MSAIAFEGTSTNPEIEAIADRVFQMVRASIYRATHGLNNVSSTTLPQKGIESAAFNFLKKYQTINRAGVSRLSGLSRAGGSRFDISIPLRLRGTAGFDFASPKTILEQAKNTGFFSGLKLSSSTLAGVTWNGTKFVPPGDPRTYANAIIKALAFKRILNPVSSGTAQPPAPAKAKELRLKITRLKAVRRFGWEITDFGNDAISCGGAGEDSVEQVVTAPSFDIHTFTRDGEDFNINPDRTFVSFNLNRPGPWPRSFSANVFLAERDASGGFIEFLQKLWEAIGPEVVTIASTLAVAAIAATAGAAIGTELMPLVGTIVGAVIGAVIGLVVGWMLDSLKDDIFQTPEGPIWQFMPTQDTLFPGNSNTTAVELREFSLGSARYLMSYYWQLVF
jgi:hypothetical protein